MSYSRQIARRRSYCSWKGFSCPLCSIHSARSDPPRLTMSRRRPSRTSRSTDARVTPQWTVMKSTPSLACFSIPAKKSSAVSSTHDFPLRLPSAAAWYRGTVPMGTGHSARIARRISSIGPPVDRSITASAPAATAARIFSISSEMSARSREEPTFAFTLIVRPSPMATGRISRRFRLRGMTTLPAAIRSRSVAGSTRSDSAAMAIAGGISPCRARCINVMAYLPFRSEKEKTAPGGYGTVRRAPRSLRRHYPGQVRRVARRAKRQALSEMHPWRLPLMIRPGERGCQTAP